MTPARLHLNENAFVDGSPALTPLVESDVNRYPPMDYADIRATVADWLGVRPAQVLLGNGSTEIIHRVYRLLAGRHPHDALYGWPSYILYRELEAIADHPARVAAGSSAQVLVAAVDPHVRLAILCTPNNPTGEVSPLADIERLLVRMRDGVLLVDEAYLDYLGDPRDTSAVALCATHPNLIVSRTFSKLYGLAGLRFGYAVTSEPLAARLSRELPNWSINAVALRAAGAVLRNRDHFDQVRVRTSAEHRRLAGGLAGHFTVTGRRELPFLLASGPGANAFAARCASQGVLVRDFDDPALPDTLRISVGSPADNDRLLALLPDQRSDLAHIGSTRKATK